MKIRRGDRIKVNLGPGQGPVYHRGEPRQQVQDGDWMQVDGYVQDLLAAGLVVPVQEAPADTSTPEEP